MRRKSVVLCLSAALLLAIYVVSYFCVRTLCLHNYAVFGANSVGVVTFSYLDDGPVHAYGLSETDSGILFLGSRTPTGRRAVSRSLFGVSERRLYGDHCWAWKLYTPLEIVEMLCREMDAVILTSEHKADIVRRNDPKRLFGDGP